MDMDIDSIINTIKAFKDSEGDYYHNALGINDQRASRLMDIGEGIVYNYLEGQDDEWEVEDIMSDLLWACKFHTMMSNEMFFFICYSYNFLAGHIEPVVFDITEGGDGFVGGNNLNIDLN
jgi:hypothetical protein